MGSNENKSFHYVFVYGTLKKGEPNYHVITNKNNGFSEFVGGYRTVEKYPLVIASKYNIPFLLDLKLDTGNQIIGEVYKVDDDMFSALDELENHPEFYIRRLEPVEPLRPGMDQPILCWIYFLPDFKTNMLRLPFYSDYSSSGNHGLPYIPSDDITSANDIDI